MADEKLNELNTVTVIAARLVGREGATALALVTKEAGTIAFEIDLHAIETIRKTPSIFQTRLQQKASSFQDEQQTLACQVCRDCR